MNAYLTKHKYSNTFTEDLWAALGEASGKPINDIMSTWTKQMGFPVLSVSYFMKQNSNLDNTISVLFLMEISILCAKIFSKTQF